MDWLRLPQRLSIGISIIWKVVIKSMDSIIVGITWKIQSGSAVRIGLDPWTGCGNAHRLPIELTSHLNVTNIAHSEHSTLFQQAWKSAHHLNIPYQWYQTWNDYIKALTEAHIRISEGEDEIIWALSKVGRYSPNEGYLVLIESRKPLDIESWWQNLWKLKAPTRCRFLMWTILKTKFP